MRSGINTSHIYILHVNHYTTVYTVSPEQPRIHATAQPRNRASAPPRSPHRMAPQASGNPLHDFKK